MPDKTDLEYPSQHRNYQPKPHLTITELHQVAVCIDFYCEKATFCAVPSRARVRPVPGLGNTHRPLTLTAQEEEEGVVQEVSERDIRSSDFLPGLEG